MTVVIHTLAAMPGRRRRAALMGASALVLAAELAYPHAASAFNCVAPGGTITAACTGYSNSGTLSNLTNSGSISGGATGIDNGATIDVLTNSGTISGISYNGIRNSGGIGILNNSGVVIAAGTYGIDNIGTIGSLTNSGLINAGHAGVGNIAGSITALTNQGTISGSGYAIENRATIGTLTNTGTITSVSAAIMNIGSIGTLINSGTISTNNLTLYNFGSTGRIDLLINSGVIDGGISSASQDLTIAGGSNGTVGTLTGLSGSTNFLNAPGVTFTSGALLLNDTINVGSGSGMVRNAGARLQVNQAISITGNYTQGSSGALVIGVSSSASYGRLVVSGGATLTNATITITAVGGAVLAAGASFTVVSAGTLTANGVSATTNGFSDVVTVKGDTLVVTLTTPVTPVTPVTPESPVTPATPALPAPTPTWTQRADAAGRGAMPMGPVLDTLSAATAFQPMLAQLSSLPPPEQTHALRQLNVSQVTPQLNAAANTTAPTTLAVEQHEIALRDGPGRAAGSQYRQGALWGQVLGGQAVQDSNGKADGYKVSSFGLLFGGDIPVSDDLVGGLALNWLRGNSRGKTDSSGNTTRLDSYQLTAYGSWRPDGGAAFAQGLLAAGFNHYDQKRAVDFLGATAAAKFDGRHYQAKLGGGYDIPMSSGLTATPVGSLQVVRVESDAYRENGAGLADLAVNRQGFNAAESELGGMLASGVIAGWWGTVQGDVKATWVHSFINSPIAISAAMGGQGFVSSTERPAADGLRLATGITLLQSDDLSIRLEYDGEMRRDYRSHIGLLKLRHDF